MRKHRPRPPARARTQATTTALIKAYKPEHEFPAHAAELFALRAWIRLWLGVRPVLALSSPASCAPPAPCRRQTPHAVLRPGTAQLLNPPPTACAEPLSGATWCPGGRRLALAASGAPLALSAASVTAAPLIAAAGAGQQWQSALFRQSAHRQAVRGRHLLLRCTSQPRLPLTFELLLKSSCLIRVSLDPPGMALGTRMLWCAFPMWRSARRAMPCMDGGRTGGGHVGGDGRFPETPLNRALRGVQHDCAAALRVQPECWLDAGIIAGAAAVL